MNEYLKIGKLQEKLFDIFDNMITPGINILEINKRILLWFERNNCTLIKNSIPVSFNINNKVYHALPGSYCLKNRDILTIDICFRYNDIIIDGAKTYILGDVSSKTREMVKVNKELLNGLCDYIKVGTAVKDILKYTSDFVATRGFYLVPAGMGHGIGTDIHEPPFISLNDFKDFEYILKKGDYFTLEPIILLLKDSIVENEIGEGIVSKYNLSSQFEISIYIDDKGVLNILNKALLK